MSGTADPAALLRAALEAGIDPLLALARFRAAQDGFHAEFASATPVSCRRGCAACCAQMVFDVTAVEVEDLGRHLRRTGRDGEVVERLRHRRAVYDRVRLHTPREDGESDDDWIERVARAFWAEGVPCALLAPDGSCSVHAHRPQSCRRFFVRGPAELCTAESADDPRRQACLVEPGQEDEVDALLFVLGRRIAFDPEDDRLDHALLRWLEHRSAD